MCDKGNTTRLRCIRILTCCARTSRRICLLRRRLHTTNIWSISRRRNLEANAVGREGLIRRTVITQGPGSRVVRPEGVGREQTPKSASSACWACLSAIARRVWNRAGSQQQSAAAVSLSLPPAGFVCLAHNAKARQPVIIFISAQPYACRRTGWQIWLQDWDGHEKSNTTEGTASSGSTTRSWSTDKQLECHLYDQRGALH